MGKGQRAGAAPGNGSRGSVNDNAMGAAPAPRPKHAFGLHPIQELGLDLDPPYLIKGLMPARGLHVLYGPAGLGKSFLALDAALHVAAGKSWAGRRVRQGGVVYVATEGAAAFATRIHAALERREIPRDIPFALVAKAPNLGLLDCNVDEFVEDLSAQAGRLGFSPRLVVLDTLARTILGLDESSSRDMGIFVRNAERIGDRLGALVMPVHHTGKDEGRGMRGSSALNGAADAQWQLKRDARGILFNVEKMKDGPSGFDVRFELEEVEVGTDADGDAVTTRVVGFPEAPVVVEPQQAKPARALKRHETLGMFAAALAACGGTGTDRAEGLSDDVVAARWDVVRAAVLAKLKAGGSAPDQARVSVNRDSKALQKEGALARSGDWVWLKRGVGTELAEAA